MVKIKHSKYKNTGLLFNLLTRQLTSDVLEGKESPCIKVIEKYFKGKSILAKEYKLYEAITSLRDTSPEKASATLTTVLELSAKFNKDILTKHKYNLIKEIKEHYDLEEFFSIKTPEYRTYAATYCLMEAHNTPDLVNPDTIIENKTTLLKAMTTPTVTREDSRESLIEEFSKYDNDLRLLTYKILLEKFNKKYTTLLPEQREVLKEFIVSVSSSKKLKNTVNSRIEAIKEELNTLNNTVEDNVLKIKINELLNHVTPVKANERVKDSHLVTLMSQYELLKELRNGESK
jgi:hypothetical protein